MITLTTNLTVIMREIRDDVQLKIITDCLISKKNLFLCFITDHFS